MGHIHPPGQARTWAGSPEKGLTQLPNLHVQIAIRVQGKKLPSDPISAGSLNGHLGREESPRYRLSRTGISRMVDGVTVRISVSAREQTKARGFSLLQCLTPRGKTFNISIEMYWRPVRRNRFSRNRADFTLALKRYMSETSAS